MSEQDPKVTGALSDVQPPTLPLAAGQSLPKQIGRYKVEKLVGEGGFGRVFLAHDEELGRNVAIKVPHAKWVFDAERIALYRQEARIVANLNDPHIVKIYDVGSTAEHPFFLVLEFIEGCDLATWLQKSPLSRTKTIRLVAKLAETLHHAHKHGLVHRDVKPGNILLDQAGKPYLVDFGLALRDEDVGKGPVFVGTVAYMSPEQAAGAGHRVDGRSDIFGLGVILYELLVKHRPFRADSSDKLLLEIKTQDPRPPRQYDETIPKELERICLKALAKRPDDRYSTAHDLADELMQLHKTLRKATGHSSRLLEDASDSGGHVATIDTARASPANRSRKPLVKVLGLSLVAAALIGAGFFALTILRNSTKDSQWNLALNQVRKAAEEFQLQVRHFSPELKQTLPDTGPLMKSFGAYQQAVAIADPVATTAERREELQQVKRPFLMAHTNLANKLAGLLDGIDRLLPDAVQSLTVEQKDQLKINLSMIAQRISELQEIKELLTPYARGRLNKLSERQQSLTDGLNRDRGKNRPALAK